VISFVLAAKKKKLYVAHISASVRRYFGRSLEQSSDLFCGFHTIINYILPHPVAVIFNYRFAVNLNNFAPSNNNIRFTAFWRFSVNIVRQAAVINMTGH
jgi:hypothetical protein